MLVDLGQDVYQEEYERHLLAEAVTWYRLEAAEFVASSSCPDYLRKVRGALGEYADVGSAWTWEHCSPR